MQTSTQFFGSDCTANCKVCFKAHGYCPLEEETEAMQMEEAA